MFGKYYTDYIQTYLIYLRTICLSACLWTTKQLQDGIDGSLETHAAPLVTDRQADERAATEVTQKQQMTISPFEL